MKLTFKGQELVETKKPKSKLVKNLSENKDKQTILNRLDFSGKTVVLIPFINKIKRYLIYLIIFSFIIILSGYSYFNYLHLNSLKETIEIQRKELDRKEREVAFLKSQGFYPRLTNKEDFELDNLQLGGWIPEWAYEEGKESLIFKLDSFSNASPIYYKLNSLGGIDYLIEDRSELRNEVEEELIFSSLNKEVEIIPTLQSFDKEYVDILVNSDEKIREFTKVIIEDLKENNLNGLDLNIEIIEVKNKQKFYEFLAYLSSELKSNGLKLTMPVLPKWGSDTRVYSYLPETREVMDYKEISKYVDELRIMAYDFTGMNEISSGPIAPLDWIKEVLDYSLARVEKDKLSLGIHLYGYSWKDKGGSNGAITYSQVMKWQEKGLVKDILYSEQYNEGLVKYSSGGESITAYFATPQSVQDRLLLAQSYGISKVHFWRLGGDPL